MGMARRGEERRERGQEDGMKSEKWEGESDGLSQRWLLSRWAPTWVPLMGNGFGWMSETEERVARLEIPGVWWFLLFLYFVVWRLPDPLCYSLIVQAGLVVWDSHSKFAHYIRWKQQFGCLWLFVSFILALSFFYLPLIICCFFLSLVLGSVVFCWCFVCIVKWSLPLMVAWKEQMWTGQILSSPASMCRCSWAQHSEAFVLSKCVLVEFRPAKK